MKIYKEIDSFDEFEAWSGGADTLNDLTTEQQERLWNYAEEIFPEGCDETELNDWLWFDRDSIYEYLDLDENGREKYTEEWACKNIDEFLTPKEYSVYTSVFQHTDFIKDWASECYDEGDKDEDELHDSFYDWAFEYWRAYIADELSDDPTANYANEDFVKFMDEEYASDCVEDADTVREKWEEYKASKEDDED